MAIAASHTAGFQTVEERLRDTIFAFYDSLYAILRCQRYFADAAITPLIFFFR